MATITGHAYRARIFCSMNDKGWSESVDLVATDEATAKSYAQYFAQIRAAMFNPGPFEIIASQLTDLLNPGWSKAALDATMQGTYTVPATIGSTTPPTPNPAYLAGKPNLSNDTLLLRIETGDGKHAMRHLHGFFDQLMEQDDVLLPDLSVIAAINGATTLVLPTPPAPIVLTYADGWDLIKLYRDFLCLCTRLVKKTGTLGGTGVNALTVTGSPVNRLVIRGPSTHKCGRPFGQRPGRRAA